MVHTAQQQWDQDLRMTGEARLKIPRTSARVFMVIAMGFTLVGAVGLAIVTEGLGFVQWLLPAAILLSAVPMLWVGVKMNRGDRDLVVTWSQIGNPGQLYDWTDVHMVQVLEYRDGLQKRETGAVVLTPDADARLQQNLTGLAKQTYRNNRRRYRQPVAAVFNSLGGVFRDDVVEWLASVHVEAMARAGRPFQQPGGPQQH